MIVHDQQFSIMSPPEGMNGPQLGRPRPGPACVCNDQLLKLIPLLPTLPEDQLTQLSHSRTNDDEVTRPRVTRCRAQHSSSSSLCPIFLDTRSRSELLYSVGKQLQLLPTALQGVTPATNVSHSSGPLSDQCRPSCGPKLECQLHPPFKTKESAAQYNTNRSQRPNTRHTRPSAPI